MKIAFLLNQPYPHALACTKRIHLYAKGLQNLQNDVCIFIPRATESVLIKNQKTSGEYEGVRFQYASNTTIRSKSFIIRRISDVISPVKAAFQIFKSNPDIIFMISTSFYHIILLKIVSLLCQAKYVKERNEVPYMHQDSLNTSQLLYLKLEAKFFDATVFITKELESYYRDQIKFKKHSSIIPIIAKFRKQESVFKSFATGKKLVYTGNMLQRKDGILTILEAFSLFLKDYPDYKLFITGIIKKNQDYYNVVNTINDLGITKSVVFTGYLTEEALKELIDRADVLLLAKPENRQNKYNFPTKVGEYLATGKPVLISDVGEIASYFNDEEDIFMTSPDAASFYKKLKFIIENYTFACKVAKRGFMKAADEFNYKTCSVKLNEFLCEL